MKVLNNCKCTELCGKDILDDFEVNTPVVSGFVGTQRAAVVFQQLPLHQQPVHLRHAQFGGMVRQLSEIKNMTHEFILQGVVVIRSRVFGIKGLKGLKCIFF